MMLSSATPDDRPMQVAQREIRTQSSPLCNLCGAEGKILYLDLSDPYFDAPGLWQLKKCPQSTCGLLWLDPAPIEADLHLAYQTYFTHTAEDDQPALRARVRKF